MTHSRDEVYRMCDRVCVLPNGHSGRTVSTRELFDAPATLAEAVMSGCKNVSAATPVGDHALSCVDWGVTLACEREAAGSDHAGIRAHDLRLVEADGRAVGDEGGSEDAGVAAGGTAAAGDAAAGAAAAGNRIPCAVARVIDNVFSTIVMCATPGGAQLRLELEKGAWARIGSPERVTLAVDPASVMPLAGSSRGGASGAEVAADAGVEVTARA